MDDEPDVLETLEDTLSICITVKATSFEEAKELLETQHFDMAILDIMGVDGYKLLEIACSRDMIAVIFTANALSPDDIVRSYKKGAASYLPKDEMVNISIYLNELLEAKATNRHFWSRWLGRWGSYYDKKFGPDWRKHDRDFWEKFEENG